MIKSTLKKTFQLIFILMIAYAGSFVLMEETSEKSEKTEKSEEALHYSYHSKNFGRTLSKSLVAAKKNQLRRFQSAHKLTLHSFERSDYNINFIYHTSYLELLG